MGRGVEEQASPVARGISRGALVNLCGDALDLLGAPLLYLFIGRVMGAEALGVYVLAASYVAILLRFGVMGFDKAMLLFVPAAASRPDRRGTETSVLGTALRWTLALSALVCAAALLFPGAVLAVGRGASSSTATRWMMIMVLAVPAQAITRVLLFAMRGRNVMWAFVVVQSVVAPLALIAASTLPVLFGCGASALPIGFVVSSVVTVAAAVVVFSREFPDQTIAGILRAPRDTAVLRFSFPQGLTESLNFVMARIDIIMLAAFFPNRMELVAFYGVASLLAGVVKRVRVAFDNSFSPVFARFHAEGDRHAMSCTYRETSAAITSLFVLAAGALCFASPSILALYGPDYEALWIAVPVLVFGRLLNAAGGPAQAALLMSGRSQLELANNIVICAVNVGLNLLLIPRFHVYGAAVASSVAFTLLNAVRIVEVKRILGIWADLKSVGASLALGAVASIPCALVLFVVPNLTKASIAAAVMFAITYVVASARYGRGLDFRRLMR